MAKTVVLTGIRANNDLHIGNYFGGLVPIVDLAKETNDAYDIYLFVPDLHSITTPIDYNDLQSTIFSNLKMFVAAGLPLSKPNVYIYRQSCISAHSELAWILDCFCGFGELSRMTQFKDKSGALENDRVSVGLFNYPVLMAADILLYNASYVPVGDDQTQHLEFTRDIAERFNKQFGDIFTVPKPVSEQHSFFNKDQGLRIKNLSDPTKKMSKSDQSSRGVIFLSDNPEDIKTKVMSATTDSVNQVNYDKVKQPGIANLLDILALVRKEDVNKITQEHKSDEGYVKLKSEVAESLQVLINTLQSEYEKTSDNDVRTKLESSEAEVKNIAIKTLAQVQTAVGLR